MSTPRLVINSEELRRRRVHARLSPKMLAERSGISLKRIQDYEGTEGVRTYGIRAESAHALAAALGCRAEDITDVVEEATA